MNINPFKHRQSDYILTKTIILLLTFLFLSSTLPAQKSTFLIIDTLDYPKGFDIVSSETRLRYDPTNNWENMTYVLYRLYGYHGKIKNHDPRYWYKSNYKDELKNFHGICLEFISGEKDDTIAFPLDDNGGLLYFLNTEDLDTIHIPRYSIIKNDVADSTYTIIDYEKEMRDGSYIPMKQEAFWSKPDNNLSHHPGKFRILINDKYYTINPILKNREDEITFHGYRFRKHRTLHKLLGIKQLRYGGVEFRYYTVLNAYIKLN